MRFHPIRKSWNLVLEEEYTIVDEIGGARRGDIKVAKGEGTEGVKGEESDVEVVDGVGEGSDSAWSNAAAPGSPPFSVLTDGESLPPTSDASTEFIDVVDSDDEGVQGGSTLKRKASNELCVGTKRWKVARADTGGRGGLTWWAH